MKAFNLFVSSERL